MTSLHLITGAGSGIGAAVARALVARGDEVLLAARSPARAAELKEMYPEAETFVADLARPASLAADLASARLPNLIDSVLHIAGVLEVKSVESQSAEEIQRQIDVNLIAPAIVTRACLPSLRHARGLVVFLNSGAGLSAHPQYSAYSASKFGLRALAQALRTEEQLHGLRVSTIYPGRTATPMQRKAHAQEAKDYDPSQWISPETVAATVLFVLDLPRNATITDLVVRPTSPPTEN